MNEDQQNDSNEEKKDQTNQEDTEAENDPAPPTVTNDSSGKTTDETTKAKRRLFSNKIIMLVVALVLLSLFIIAIIVYFTVIRDPKLAKLRAKAKAKCDEYAKFACNQESTKSNPDDLSRIWHGTDASPGIIPHMAYLVVFNAKDVNECTGSLISEHFVLTASHCFKKRKPKENIIVFLASKNKPTPGKGTPPIITQEIYMHPKYNKSKLEGDIALVKLPQKVKFSKFLRPICLNTQLDNNAGDFISSGYGLIEGDVESQRLRMVAIRLDGEVQSKCYKEIVADFNYEDFTQKMICAGHPTEKKGGSLGDSGGPLQIPLKHECPNVYEQVGVLSQGRNFTTHEPPVILLYSKVEYYIPWIVEIVWPDGV